MCGCRLLKGEFYVKMAVKGVKCYGQKIKGVFRYIRYKPFDAGRCAREDGRYKKIIGNVSERNICMLFRTDIEGSIGLSRT